MRAPLLIAALMLATPAMAQVDSNLDRSIALRAEQDMARQQLNALQNEIYATQSRLQTEQTLRELQSQRALLRVRPQAPLPPADASTPPPADGGYAAIPDAMLADSNARVRAASQGAR